MSSTPSYIRLDKLRSIYKPLLPNVLEGVAEVVSCGCKMQVNEEVEAYIPHLATQEAVMLRSASAAFQPRPLKVGVLLSGGQAPGGHNVIAGLFDALKMQHEASELYGFVMGPGGLLRGEVKELTADVINRYRNSGGFDMIGSDRTKLETTEQFEQALRHLHRLKLDALVIIGGDDSNTNAALLAEYCQSIGDPIAIIGCPKTIDGDLKNQWIETSFGFDTCVKVYAELVGNIQRDCYSSKKYWHFVKLMGRSASHLTLECALMTQPNITIISEEVAAREYSLEQIVSSICDIIVARSKRGIDFGVVLIPEGLIEFVPRMRRLIQALNRVLAENGHKLHLVKEEQIINYVAGKLPDEEAITLRSLPEDVAQQLMFQRDPHGNVQVSRIETEELLVTLVTEELEARKKRGEYPSKFSALTHFFGYEGRCSMPSNFDAAYCYALGRTAIALLTAGCTGYMATIKNLVHPPTEWVPYGIPLASMLTIEDRNGKKKPVIAKSLVDLLGAPFHYFRSHRKEWADGIEFRYPGPIQYFGPSAVCDSTTITLRLEHALEPEGDLDAIGFPC